MTEPAQEPPQSAREHPTVLIVRDDLHPRSAGIADAKPPERIGEHQRVRQRMPSIRPGSGAGKIVVQVRVDGAGNVTAGVFAPAPPVVVQLEATVDDDNRWILKMTR